MKLDVIGLYVYEALLMTLGVSPGSGLWATLGRQEAGLCSMFAAVYPSRRIQHLSASNWADLAESGSNPGAFLINLELKIADQVIEYAGGQNHFCIVGLYSNIGTGLERSRLAVTDNMLYYELSTMEQWEKPIKLLQAEKNVRLALSINQSNLDKTGRVLGVDL
jgi:hypothetical protein